MINIKVLCINSNDRPKKIPKHKWITKGQEYTLIDVQLTPDKKVLGFYLKEVSLGPESAPFQVYSMFRFSIDEKDVIKFNKFVKEKIKKTIDI